MPKVYTTTTTTMIRRRAVLTASLWCRYPPRGGALPHVRPDRTSSERPLPNHHPHRQRLLGPGVPGRRRAPAPAGRGRILHPSLNNDEGFLRRFVTEARASATLNHAHILAVYDWGDDGPTWSASSATAGACATSSTRITCSPCPRPWLALGRRALDHAHRRGAGPSGHQAGQHALRRGRRAPRRLRPGAGAG